LRLLEADPIFASMGLGDLVGTGDPDEVLDQLPAIFRKLSSGHKIVLLTITKLVETVEEKSLVLLDEPEAHLHLRVKLLVCVHNFPLCHRAKRVGPPPKQDDDPD
jgi:hypothetical protein